MIFREIANTGLDGNNVIPEAGFDGLMQVISEANLHLSECSKTINTRRHLLLYRHALGQVLLCGSELGWRSSATKIIVLITDSSLHVAGDGLIAGIWKPYDTTQCSLVPVSRRLAVVSWKAPPSTGTDKIV